MVMSMEEQKAALRLLRAYQPHLPLVCIRQLKMQLQEPRHNPVQQESFPLRLPLPLMFAISSWIIRIFLDTLTLLSKIHVPTYIQTMFIKLGRRVMETLEIEIIILVMVLVGETVIIK